MDYFKKYVHRALEVFILCLLARLFSRCVCRAEAARTITAQVILTKTRQACPLVKGRLRVFFLNLHLKVHLAFICGGGALRPAAYHFSSRGYRKEQ